MKYCLTYQKNHQELMNSADELNIIYNKEDITLPDFIELYKNKRINIYIDNVKEFYQDSELKKIIGILEKDNNYDIALKLSEDHPELIQQIKENNIKFYLDIFVNNWDTFCGLINYGVSDIYIVEQMGFEIDKCSEKAHQNNVKIRVFPNIAQSKWSNMDGIKKFFIRPEDIIAYEQYVDVCEFITDITREKVLYNIYAKDQRWDGNLNDLITGLNYDIDSRTILPYFSEARIKCKKRCLIDNKCQVCDRIKSLSKTLEENELFFSKVKEIEKEGEE